MIRQKAHNGLGKEHARKAHVCPSPTRHAHKADRACVLHMQGMQQRPPIVVAAHGIAGQKDMGLEPFAELFATKGMAVLLFDYRNFGVQKGSRATGCPPRGTSRTGTLLWTMSG